MIRQGLKADGYDVSISGLCRCRCSEKDGLLPTGGVGAEAAGALRRADQGHDRGEPVVRIPDGRAPARVRQEHRAADLLAQGLAGSQAPDRLRTARKGAAVGGTAPERTLGDGYVPSLGRRDKWTTLALVIDCHMHELLGWHLSRSGRLKIAEAVLEHTLIARFGALGRLPQPFLRR